jgi:hypothetical protein
MVNEGLMAACRSASSKNLLDRRFSHGARGQDDNAALADFDVSRPVESAQRVLPGHLEYFPEKWTAVFRRKCDQRTNLGRFPIQSNRKAS